MSRSYLFIPGNTPSMLQNLDVFESDAIIIDFEDSVTTKNKDACRILVKEFLTKYTHFNMEIYIRINDIDTPYFIEDLAYTKDLNITGYVYPKATQESISKLMTFTTKPIIPIIESPMGVLDAKDIAKHDQVKALLLGAEDYTKEMNVSRTVEATEIFYVRNHISIVSKAYQKESIDTPFTDKDNMEALKQDARNAKQLGFTSKACIHPNQVEVVNQVFSPSKAEILEAQRIVLKASQEQKGAFSLDGKMIDAPIIEKANNVLKEAKKYNLL